METAVIIEGARTPIGRFLGAFADTPAVELGTLAAQEAMRRADIAPEQIDQTILAEGGHAKASLRVQRHEPANQGEDRD